MRGLRAGSEPVPTFAVHFRDRKNREAGHDASELGRTAMERTRVAGPQARRAARRASSTMRETVRDYPLTAVITTATVAFVLGAAWQAGSRRSSSNGWFNRSSIDSWLDGLQHYAEPGMRALGRDHYSRWR